MSHERPRSRAIRFAAGLAVTQICCAPEDADDSGTPGLGVTGETSAGDVADDSATAWGSPSEEGSSGVATSNGSTDGRTDGSADGSTDGGTASIDGSADGSDGTSNGTSGAEPPSVGACEPVVQVAAEDFEDGEWTDSFDGTFNPENVTIDETQARSGTHAARMYGGYLGAAFDYGLDVAEGDCVYLRYWVYYPADGWDWDGISGSGLKQVRFMPPDGWPIWTFKWNGMGQPATHGGFSEGEHPEGIDAWHAIGQFPSADEWHEVEVLVRWSETNGGFVWRYDGERIAGSDAFEHDTWPPPMGFVDGVRFAGGNGFPDGSVYYVDDVEIWISG